MKIQPVDNSVKQYRTIKKFPSYLFNILKTRARQNSRIVSFSKEDFEKKFIVYKNIYVDWVNSNFEKTLTPSIRIKSAQKKITLDDIILLPFYENVLKEQGSLKIHLKDKRNELIFALNHQGYNGQEIGAIFNINRSTVHDILKLKPKNYKPKWIKTP